MYYDLLTSYEMDDGGKIVRFPAEEKHFSLSHIVQTGSEANPAFNLRLSKYYSPEVKLPERVANY